jgi:hypothetical protein
MIDTLTTQQKSELLQGNYVGIFPTMFLDTDEFYSTLSQICFGYYMERSGNKSISPSYERLIEMSKSAEGLEETAEQLLGKYIRGKYIAKWRRVYDALVFRNYDPLNDYERVESKYGDNYNKTTYDTSVVNDGNSSMSEKTVRDVETGDDVYGFNSENVVGESKSTDSLVETVTGDAEHNKTHNAQTKSGSDSNYIKINESYNRRGRDNSAAKLIAEELDMRSQQIFYDIIYSDIDSIATLQIYI